MNRTRIAKELLKIAKALVPDDAIDIPDTRQTYNYDCGSTATQTVLSYYGIDIRGENLMEVLETEPEDGTPIDNIIGYLRQKGLKVVAGRMSLETLEHALSKKFPVILPLQAWVNDDETTDWKTEIDNGHYVVAIGSDDNKVFFEDPASFQRVYVPKQEFLDRWHDKDSNGKIYLNYGIVVIGKRKYDKDVALPME
jgi:predicted double-glycine peptidase